MMLKIVGVQRMDYKFDDGKEIHGYKLYGIELEREVTGLTGNIVQSVMIRDENPMSAVALGLKPGDECRLYFGKSSNRVEFLQVK